MLAPTKPLQFVILASGTGTNARALMEHARRHPELLQCVGLVSDRASALALNIAKEYGVETAVIPAKNEAALLAFLAEKKPTWACLAGYMRIVGQGFLDFFADQEFFRVINVHPSLLPAYPGMHGYQRAFADGVKVAGVTVHFVDGGLDSGRVISQGAFTREESDSEASFEAKGRKIELKLFPEALELAAKGCLKVGRSRWVSTEKL
jgi:phosphoribosylglycinamide formyltransferase-1